ncbi:MAG: mechanosensitive ion channel family protein, partial [Planctomycetota bacterium]
VGPKLKRLLALVFALFYVLSLVAQKAVRRSCAHLELHQSLTNLLRQVVRVTLLLVGAICALGTVEVNVSALVASLGLTGFALGFALKDVLANLMAGVLILIHRPFVVGDLLEVAGKQGKVTGIDLRYTSLEHEGKLVLIPNQTTFTNVVVVERKKT